MLKNEWHGDAFERLGVQSANQGAPEIILQGSWLFFTPSLAGQIQNSKNLEFLLVSETGILYLCV